MVFMVGLPCSLRGYDLIWVVVDRLMKMTHFLSVKTTYSVSRLVLLYIDEIVRLYEVPLTIISDYEPQFISQF